jgi:lipopolysaccharide heptosyltransferase II
MDLAGKRILIVKPSSLGDVVHTLPVVHALKRCFPSCRIGWIVQESLRPILENDPAVDEIIPILIPSTSDPNAPKGIFLQAAGATVRTLAHLRRNFQSRPYDLVLDLHASFRSGLLALTNPGGLRIGFADAREMNTFFQHRRIAADPRKPHAVDKNLAFSDYLECPSAPEDFRAATGPAEREKARVFLEQAGMGATDRLVYANPAARWETKFWTVKAWAELADLFIGRGAARVVFGGGPGDAAYIGEIAKAMREPAVSAAGRLSLSESVALLERADVYVGVDSGPMHIAAFIGTPVVALFGPTDPAKVGPYGAGHKVIRRNDLDCLACRKRSCNNRRCLEDITAEEVFRETVELKGW